ncbi:MAG: hypothetical protein HYS13_18100 [Planctomycetia bacterium]|nr:hypothetical protein [Planctomycetia bacterium]
MPTLILNNVSEVVLRQLRDQAIVHRRTSEEEATAILTETLQSQSPADWAGVDAIYERLSASGRTFSDSAKLLREDRER